MSGGRGHGDLNEPNNERQMNNPLLVGESSSSNPNPTQTPMFNTTTNVQNILNSAAPFMSLFKLPYCPPPPPPPPLTEMVQIVPPPPPIDMDQIIPPPPRTEMDQIIVNHGDQLRAWLVKQQQEAEERASAQLRQRERELEIKAAQYEELSAMNQYYKDLSERVQRRLRYYEHLTDQLRAQAMRGGQANDAESSCAQYVEGLECRACERQMAVVMMMPCRHVSACKDCGEIVEKCPICGVEKASRVRVFMVNE